MLLILKAHLVGLHFVIESNRDDARKVDVNMTVKKKMRFLPMMQFSNVNLTASFLKVSQDCDADGKRQTNNSRIYSYTMQVETKQDIIYTE